MLIIESVSIAHLIAVRFCLLIRECAFRMERFICPQIVFAIDAPNDLGEQFAIPATLAARKGIKPDIYSIAIVFHVRVLPVLIV